MENLVQQFAKAGLKLERLEKPIVNGRGMEFIVQIDIKRKIQKNARTEYFRLYPGRGDIQIHVRDIDKERHQLVLMVKEGKRTFEEEIKLSNLASDVFVKRVKESAKAEGARILKIDPNARKATLQRSTTPAVRHYLLGVDERQLFIAQLRDSCDTVEKARKSLGKTVQFAEGKKGNSVDRQGEWFFLETTEAQRKNLDELIKKNKVAIHRKVAIGDHHRVRRNGGNPHTVDELVTINLDNVAEQDLLEHGWPVRGTQTFVRGAVRHKDHRTVVFRQWRSVVANNEGDETGGNRRLSSGIRWID